MTAVPVTHERMTAGEFLALPEPDDARRLELVEGAVIVSHPTMLHNVVQVAFVLALGTWIGEGDGRGRVCMPLDVGLDDRNVYVPDVSWYSDANAPDLDAPQPYHVPDLAIEIRSPSTWVYDVGAKRVGYERHGLPELWLIDTAADQVLVFRRSKAEEQTFDVAVELDTNKTLRTPLLPGFALALDEQFPKRG